LRCEAAAKAQIQHTLSRHTDFDADFLFGELCLAGVARAVEELREVRLPEVRKYLHRAGVTAQVTDEVLADLFTDLLTGDMARPPLLASYRGHCALATWLNTLALNRAISRMRAETRRLQRDAASVETAPMATAEEPDTALRELLAAAVRGAFERCAPENFVLLHLLHAGELRIGELSRIFDCDPQTVHARADRSAAEVRFAILSEINRRDPWLKLTFEQIIELLRPDLPGLFEPA
jgi:DNA-directed RNA polymerase specialized sigma24 family protein